MRFGIPTNAFDLLDPFLPAAENAPLVLSLSARMAFRTLSLGVWALGGGVDSPLPVLRSTRRSAGQYRCVPVSKVMYVYNLLLLAELSAVEPRYEVKSAGWQKSEAKHVQLTMSRSFVAFPSSIFSGILFVKTIVFASPCYWYSLCCHSTQARYLFILKFLQISVQATAMAVDLSGREN